MIIYHQSKIILVDTLIEERVIMIEDLSVKHQASRHQTPRDINY